MQRQCDGTERTTSDTPERSNASLQVRTAAINTRIIVTDPEDGAGVTRRPRNGGPVRGHDSRKIQPPVLSAAFSHIKTGRTQRGGYLFQIFLPGVRFVPQRESDLGGAHGAEVSANPAERVWCAYA